MSLDLLTMLLVFGLLIVGAGFHKMNMERIYAKMVSLSSKDISKEDLYEELSAPQGSNFNAFALSAWMLASIAVAYFYFLTPRISAEFNYLEVAPLAKSSFGLVTFAAVVALASAVVIVSLDLPRVYSFYEMPKRLKAAIMSTVPVLGVSITCSTYMATVYPPELPEFSTNFVSALGFVTLFASVAILLSPIYIRAMGVTK